MTLNIYHDVKVPVFIFIILKSRFNDTYLQYEIRIITENWNDSSSSEIKF